MQRLFGGDDPLLGGAGHFDATALTAVFAVMFALSIDYRCSSSAASARSSRPARRSPRRSTTGMRRTAGVVTGAALSMLAVFASFAIADVTSLRVFGVGLAIAVALDATHRAARAPAGAAATARPPRLVADAAGGGGGAAADRAECERAATADRDAGAGVARAPAGLTAA